MLLFAKLMGMVQGQTRAFDRAILLAFRNSTDLSDPIGPHWLEIIFRDITSLGGATVLTLMTIAVTGFLLIDAKRGAAILVLGSVIGGVVLSTILKLGIDGHVLISLSTLSKCTLQASRAATPCCLR